MLPLLLRWNINFEERGLGNFFRVSEFVKFFAVQDFLFVCFTVESQFLENPRKTNIGKLKFGYFKQ